MVRRSIQFDLQINQAVSTALSDNISIQNIYSLPDLTSEDTEYFETAFENAMQRPTSTFDSHPALKDRISLVKQLRTKEITIEEPQPAWDLIPNADKLQAEMTEQVSTRVENYRLYVNQQNIQQAIE